MGALLFVCGRKWGPHPRATRLPGSALRPTCTCHFLRHSQPAPPPWQGRARSPSCQRQTRTPFPRAGDVNKVVERYAPDGVLLPTLLDKVRTTPAEIADYFDGSLGYDEPFLVSLVSW